ncbi:hypothetical protein AVEN_99189-1 [Araneus ventricosus]|uniref:Uncharacterized protein n=1 Tax=Araneus ventricosus TaxID=182803 RepID=A0A4Y2CHU8_ARAVE|nr:hypothetical protein AVEN_99189-1 [Araneus ventricosus]
MAVFSKERRPSLGENKKEILQFGLKDFLFWCRRKERIILKRSIMIVNREANTAKDETFRAVNLSSEDSYEIARMTPTVPVVKLAGAPRQAKLSLAILLRPSYLRREPDGQEYLNAGQE